MALSKDGWQLPTTDADVLCVWNPQWYFSKLTLTQIAARLLEQDLHGQFAGGGIYNEDEIERLAHGTRSHTE